MLELCGMDLSITVQTEHAMFGCDQDVGAGRFQQNQAGVPATWWDELAVTSGGARRAVGMASDSARFRGSTCLKLVPFSLVATAHPTP